MVDIKNEDIIKKQMEQLFDSKQNTEFIAKLMTAFEAMYDVYMKYSGIDVSKNQAMITKGFNLFENDISITDRETKGYTFFTRPKLNLLKANLLNERIFAFLDTLEPTSPAFAIRCLLDPIFTSSNYSLAVKSPLFDPNNPFIPILTNRLINFSGAPTLAMETDSTEGGYFSESLTIAKGWDELSRVYDVTCTFMDVRGGFILALFFFWFLWINYAVKGSILPYKKYIEENRICYTISIYRFLMDETNTYITKWAKFTGCFPVNVPIETYFNYTKDTYFVHAGKELTIPFKVIMRVRYMDPVILWEFNELVSRYCPLIDSAYQSVPKDLWYLANCKIIPYINLKGGYNMLEWKCNQTFLQQNRNIVVA